MQTQLDASTYGIGELITQRKLFSVPEHQRNYSWTLEEVEQLLDDIKYSSDKNADDYFIGLVVLQGPVNGIWQILDGQQRLTTSTIIYSSIREWLRSRGFSEDAKQVENEFIGVRQLGGVYTPRLKMNSINAAVFEKYVVNDSAIDEIVAEIKKWPRNSSNRYLLEAIKFCREWVANLANTEAEREKQASILFKYSTYIEKRVRVVCLDVSSSADAYVLFEALNDRGADLSALDLVKNHIYSFASKDSIETIRNKWELVSNNIEGKDADDFLKVFWTSRFGVIQKTDLFPAIRKSYHDEPKIITLVNELTEASEIIEAIDDPEHELWSKYGHIARSRMEVLILLGSRQIRSVVLAAIEKMEVAHVV